MPANFVIKPFLEEHRAEMRKPRSKNPGFLSWMAAAEGKRPDLTMAGRAFMIIGRVGIMREPGGERI